MSKGAYVLFIRLRKRESVIVGRLGSLTFDRGTYLYIGSALHNLEKRIARHRSDTKRLHWHIDYLLQAATIVKVLIIETDTRIECLLNTTISQLYPVDVIVKGFGSSDCHCVTHLWKMASQAKPSEKELEAVIQNSIRNARGVVENMSWS